jgi:glutamyl-tRNA synthetase
LGWSHGNDEVLSVAQMIEYFSLNQVGSSGAIFDLTKLQWLNSVYLRAASPEQLLELIKVDLGIDLIAQSGFTLVQVLELIKLYQERVKLLTELSEIILLLSSSPESYDQVAISKFITSQTPDILVQVHALLSNLDDSCWNLEDVTSGLKDLMVSQGLTMPQLAQPIRLALTGHTNSPSVFHLVTVLGKGLVLTRIDQFLKAI